MIKLLRTSDFWPEAHDSPEAPFSKYYQHNQIHLFGEPFFRTEGRVGEIGPHNNFNQLVKYRNARLSVIDPYNGGAGAGLPDLPDNLPYPVSLFRCHLGVDSGVIPDEFFEITFSISVIEHIGQEESFFDLDHKRIPPVEQENVRNDFCGELFRVTKVGGLTFHTVDHAARNLTFVNNFMEAGFELFSEGPFPTVEACLNDPDAIRQRRDWHDPDKLMPDDQLPLHGVLFMAFRRPDRLARNLATFG